jgi:hypothetical protein
VDALICRAIAEKKLIEFHYKNYIRIAEPHVFGRKGGVKQLLLYQIRGGSSQPAHLPDWLRVDISEIAGLLILDETFPGSRPFSSVDHSSWDEIFAIVN